MIAESGMHTTAKPKKVNGPNGLKFGMEALGTHRKYPKIVEHKIVAASITSANPSILPVIIVLWLCSKTLRPRPKKLVGLRGPKFCVGTLGTHRYFHQRDFEDWAQKGIFSPP